MKILITGSLGFVGRHLVDRTLQLGWQTVRHYRSGTLEDDETIICDIDGHTDWRPGLNGVDCVVHCAARVHMQSECMEDAIHAYETVNVAGTLNLAQQAADAGVKRFIFVSSIKVNGDSTRLGHPFTAKVESEPSDLYGKSKYHAEIGLKQIASQTGLEVVIIRPPLVYGPGVKANFFSMIRWVDKKIPLPLGGIHNLRSLVYIGNLVDLICTCCEHPKAAGHTFLVSDNNDVSVPELLRLLATAMKVPSMMVPIPPALLTLGLGIMGKRNIAQRLCGSLQVDISETLNVLNWTPPYSIEEGIQKTVEAYKQDKTRR